MEGRVAIISDPMLATGSFGEDDTFIREEGQPSEIHIVVHWLYCWDWPKPRLMLHLVEILMMSRPRRIYCTRSDAGDPYGLVQIKSAIGLMGVR